MASTCTHYEILYPTPNVGAFGKGKARSAVNSCYLSRAGSASFCVAPSTQCSQYRMRQIRIDIPGPILPKNSFCGFPTASCPSIKILCPPDSSPHLPTSLPTSPLSFHTHDCKWVDAYWYSWRKVAWKKPSAASNASSTASSSFPLHKVAPPP